MKKLLYLACAAVLLCSCKDFLGIESLEKSSPDRVFTDPASIKATMATLYLMMPIEDFNYYDASTDLPDPATNITGYGFNSRNAGALQRGFSTSFRTDESMNAAGTILMPSLVPVAGYWGYNGIRNVNTAFSDLPTVKGIKQQDLDMYLSELHFIRAYMYFGLAKRYGGIPLIDHAQQMDEDIYTPRSTEKQTWDFILAELDKAIAHLPTEWPADKGRKRATVWAAYALKSRVALHAASIAKYWNNAPLVGQAVNQKLVGGMTADDASEYYRQCVEACEKIMQDSGKELYKPAPATAAEAAANYQLLFEKSGDQGVQTEVIFSKAFTDGSQSMVSVYGKQGHNMDILYQPSQTQPGFLCWGRHTPTLDLVDLYEDYTDDGTGASAKLATRVDGNENTYLATPGATGIGLLSDYIQYDDPAELLAGKDARLKASMLYNGAVWRGKSIIIQAGLVKPDGSAMLYVDGSATGNDGKTYYTYGGPTNDSYSGFYGMTNGTEANFTTTGFSLRKFLQEGKALSPDFFTSTNDFIDLRLAEIYLNYAEAAAESGLGNAALASQCLNAIRHRAGHTDDISLTLANVLKERRVELAFEGQRYWDLVRRREFHTGFTQRIRKALLPMVDLRGATPKYIFVRANNYYDNSVGGLTFQPYYYYLPIPGIASNNLVQNPQY